MKRVSLLLLYIALILPACGCAVAVTANVDMPESFAHQAAVVQTAARVKEDATVDVEPNEAETPDSPMPVLPEAQIAPISADEGMAPLPGEAVITPFEEPVPMLTAAPSASPEASAEPTPEATAEPTSEPTPKAAKEPEYTVEKIDRTAGYVSAGSVNLRKGPDTDYDILGEYEQNDELVIKGVCGDWYQVKIDGTTGFMLKEYVRKGSASTPKPTTKPTPKPTQKPTPEPTLAPTPEPAVIAPSTNASSLSDELYLAAQLVNEESGADGYVAVANVIYNRVQSSKFPNSIAGVVFQANQFTPSESEAELRSVKPSSGAIAAVRQVFVDGNRILPDNVLYFRAARSGTSWGSRTYYATIGGNAFFS